MNCWSAAAYAAQDRLTSPIASNSIIFSPITVDLDKPKWSTASHLNLVYDVEYKAPDWTTRFDLEYYESEPKCMPAESPFDLR